MKKQKRKKNDGYKISDKNLITKQVPKGFPMDPQGMTTMKWTQIKTITIASLVALSYKYKVNSINDPDPDTGGTRKPYGYNQFFNFYNKYRVLKVEVKIKIPPPNNGLCFAGGFTNDVIPVVPTTGATYEDFCNIPFVKSITTGSGANIVTIKSRMNLNKLTGRTREEYVSDDITGAVFAADPGELCYFYIAWFSPTGNTAIFTYQIEIEYYLMMYDPNTLAVSTLRLSPEEEKMIEYLRNKHKISMGEQTGKVPYENSSYI